MSFWDELYSRGKPVIGLSPMDGVTDAPMRYMSAKYGEPDIVFSEFVSVDALHYATGERRERLLKTFVKARDIDAYSSTPVLQSSSELLENRKTGTREHHIRRPYEIAQIFGNKPDYFGAAAELIESLGFDGVDINMGCPAHKVEEQGSGAGLIRTPKVAQEIVKAVKKATSLPVSVKTRIGVDSVVVEDWMETLMEVEPANITLHGRTLRQLYQGSADWEAIGRAAEVVHKHGGHILGNGDVLSLADGLDKATKHGVDGFLIGRAAEGNPAIFQRIDEPSVAQRLAWIREHVRVYDQVFGPGNFMPMRKHLAWYCKGFPGASELRTKLVMSNSRQEVDTILASVV